MRRVVSRVVTAMVSGVVLLAAAGCASGTPQTSTHDYERGVNVYTLEMNRGSDVPVSQWGEPQSSYDYLASRGVSIVRLAFSWDMLQPVPGDPTPGNLQDGMDGPVDNDAMVMLQQQVQRMENAGIRPILDLHNGCSYPTGPNADPKSSVFCGDGISVEQQVDIWLAISNAFKDDPSIYAYDLFNEPRTANLTFETYQKYSQAVVDAIRGNGDAHTLWVNAMIGDWSFASNAKKGPWIVDSDGQIDETIVYSSHFYPGGTARENRQYDDSATYLSFLSSIKRFGKWCEDWSARCSIGELGWPNEQSQERWGGDDGAWNRLGEEAYQLADHYGMDVTYFAAMSSKGGYLLAYDSSQPTFPPGVGIDQAQSQAEIIERHRSRNYLPWQAPPPSFPLSPLEWG